MDVLRTLYRRVLGEHSPARPSPAWRRLATRLDLSFLLAALLTSGLKVISAALNYGLLVLLARRMSVDDFGLFGILFSAMALVGAFIFCGQPVLVLKNIPFYGARGDVARQKGVLLFGMAVLLATSVAFASLLAIGQAAGMLPGALRSVHLTVAFAALTIVFALSDYSCNVLRAFGQTYAGLVPRDLLWRLLAILAVLAMSSIDVLTVMCLLGWLLGLLVAWQFWAIWRLVRAQLAGPALFNVPAWRAATVWMAIGSVLFAVSLTLDTVIVGALVGADDAAVYFAAVRTAGLSALLLVGLRLVAAPIFAHLHSSAAHDDLHRKITLIYLLSLVTAALFALVGYVLAPEIMKLFGAEYAAGTDAFRILLIGLSVATAGGVSSSILESTGGERLNASVLLITQTLTAGAVALGAAAAGVQGAALAKAIGVSLETLLLVGCVFRRMR